MPSRPSKPSKRNRQKPQLPAQNPATPTRSDSGAPAKAQVTTIKAEFSGPLPHPEILKQYEQIQVGLAERIIAQAEREAVHRHELEKKAMDSQIADEKAGRREARLGQVFGLIIGIVTIGLGAYVAVNDAQIPGSIIGGLGITGLVGVFVYGRSRAPASQDKQSNGAAQ